MGVRFRGWWPILAVVVIAGAGLWLLYAGVGSEHVRGYVAYAVSVVTGAVGVIAWLWRKRTAKGDRGAAGPGLDGRADRLAEAVRQQWEQAAGERGLVAPEPIPVRWARPARPLAGPTAAAVAARRFDPLPGLPPASSTKVDEGHVGDLHAVYGGIGSGRLVIAGAPGSGKSGAAVLLVLAAVRYRGQVADADRPKVPVPVLVTAQGWDPARERVADWLAGQMRQTYPMFTGKAGAADAAALVAAGKVALVLDGLDELAEELRPVALRALSQQAAFRVVVLSRTAEMASAASHRGILEGAAAIELCAIDPPTAAGYLSRAQLDPPPEGWRDLIGRVLSPDSPLAQALASPLTLTLVRDTYRAGDDVRELLEFCDTAQRREHGDHLAEDIADHLLDRVVPAAYTPRPGEKPPPYDLQTAQHTLTRIAERMNQDRSRDLQWWRLPEWAPATPRILVVGLVAGLVAGLVSGLVVGLVSGLVSGLGLGLEDPDSTSSLNPLSSWRNDRKYGLGVGLGVALVIGLVVGLVAGLVSGLGVGLVSGLGGRLGGGLVAGLGLGLAVVLGRGSVLPSSLAAVQLSRRWHTPVRLMKFLDDARERGVLRTVGPAYQFRHARLQDRLRCALSGSGQDRPCE